MVYRNQRGNAGKVFEQMLGDKQALKQIHDIWAKDIYKFRHFPNGSFDYIFDIGANIGVFTILAKALHPTTPVIAVEPLQQARELFVQNVNGIDGVIVDSRALGVGYGMYLSSERQSIGSFFVSGYKEGGVHVHSISFSGLFIQYVFPHDYSNLKYFLKFDCEGAERFLIEDEKSWSILQNAIQISMEIHFQARDSPFESWATWGEFDSWINQTFKNHYVQYYHSDKRRGFGHYCIRRNDAN